MTEETRSAKIRNLLSPVTNLTAILASGDLYDIDDEEKALIEDELKMVKQNIPKILELLNQLDKFG